MHAMEPSCKTTVEPFYREVIKDVLANLEEYFVEEGIDEDVIQKLKDIWESKLLAIKAITSPTVMEKTQTSSEEDKIVPVQIVLPPQPQNNITQKMLIVHVPSFALQSNQIYNVLSGPVISATMSLPQPLATSVLQHHMDVAFKSQQYASNTASLGAASGAQGGTDLQEKLIDDGARPSTSGISQNQFKDKNQGKKRKYQRHD